MDGQKTTCGNSFSDKACRFSRDYLRYCQYILSPEAPCEGHEYTKKLFSKFIGTSHVLEDFLDFHGAKNNKNWFFYRELAAAVRHLSLGAYCQKHLLTRIASYDLGNDVDGFESEGKATLNFLTECLKKLAPVIIEEARRLGIPVPENTFVAADFPSTTTDDYLPQDIDAADAQKQQQQYLVRISSEFLNIAKRFDAYTFYERYNLEKIREIVPEKINEVEIRRYEMLVHNLQSSFDTYVIQGGFNPNNRKLKKLRTHFSVVFHLLQLMGRLLHFYERHLHESGFKNIYQDVQATLCRLLDSDALLDRTINYGLYYVCLFLSNGREVAKEVLNENIERSSIQVGVPVPRGFHCRPSLLVTRIVQHYGGQVELCVGDGRFDAGSVLDIQWAGGKILNENIRQVSFEGDIRSLHDLKILAAVNYGEDTMGNDAPLPRELAYLREM